MPCAMDKVLGKKNMKKVGLAAWRSVACNQNIAADAAVMPAMFGCTLRYRSYARALGFSCLAAMFVYHAAQGLMEERGFRIFKI